MATPQYIKNAQNKYNSKFDLVQLRLPKGTKERIKTVLQDGQSIAGYCVQCVLSALESDGIGKEPQNVREAAETQQKPNDDGKTEAEKWAELQEIFEAKRAEIEAAKQEKEANKEQKRAETIAAAKFAEE